MVDYKKIFENQLTQRGDFPDCYAFSIHKAGSSLMHKMIGDVCRFAGIPAISIPDTLFREGLFEKDWEEDEGILDLITPGRIYYGFRNLPKIFLKDVFHLKDKKAVLLIRDPRDALVSQYFSFGGKSISHRLPEKNKEAFLEKVQNTAHLEIDQYVMSAAANHRKKLIAYKNNLNFDKVLVFKYEEIYFDKRKFLHAIFNHYEILVEPELLDRVAADNDIRPESEDSTKHIRKGLPGDHLNKLQPETIQKLNDMFMDICAWYGYKLLEPGECNQCS